MDQEQIRIFISSPSDVQPERERVERVIQKLDTELDDQVRLSAIRSEDLSYTATTDFQAQIPLPSTTDLVIVIIWKRMGTPLPPDRYHRQDGTPYASGTEFEFEEARDSALAKNTPQIWMYRKTAEPFFRAESAESEHAQWVAVNDFWKKWFRTEDGYFKGAFREFSDTDQLEVQIEEHLRQWLSDQRGSRVAWPQERGSPFRGLEPFGEAHADVFFGRTQIVEQIGARLVNAASRHCPFILLIGMSGSGKSSIVRAGVIPRLRKHAAAPQVDLWRFCVLRPSELGQDLVAGLAGALHRAEVLPELADGDYRNAAELATLFRTNPQGAVAPVRSALDRAAQHEGAAGGYQRPVSACVLLVVDQLEELFARPDAERDAFAQLLSVLARGERVWVVSTIRSDFYPQYQGLSHLLRLKEDGAQFDLMPPGPAEVREIIRGPARAAGLKFDTRPEGGRTLAEILEEEAGQQLGTLPLLEFALDELYKARDRLTHTLTFAAYEELGGLTGAIRKRADAVFDALPPEARGAFDAVFQALVRVGDGDRAAAGRRTVRYDRLADDPNAKAFVDAFLQPDARLLVADRDAGGEPTVSIAHESMLNAWPRLRDWLEHNRELLRSRARVAADAELWDGAGRGSENLAAQGKALDDVKLLSRSDSIDLSEAEQAFIDQSLRSEAERIRRERRRRWAVRAIAAVVVALIVGVVWEGYTRYAEAKRSKAREKANESSDQRDSDPPTSVRLARESYELDHSIGEPALRSSLDVDKEVKVATGEHANEVHSVTVGRTVLASAFFGDGSRLWKPSSGEPVVLDDNEQAESIALDADDAIVVTAGEKGVRVWRDGGEEPPLISADEVVPGQLATVSRDGKRIAATSGNDVRIWTSADGSWKPASRHEDAPLVGHEGTPLVGHKVNGVGLSPDATLAVTAGADGTVSVWEIQTARTLVTLPGHEGGATDAVFGPDGKTVASSGKDHTARIWSARGAWSPTTWRMDMILGGHLGEVLKVAWSPGGRFVATASADNTAAIWEVNSGTQVARLRGHTDAVKSVAFTPDGSMVATGSADKTVRFWRTGAETFPLPHEASVRSARFNTDGSFVLTASKGQDTMARIWHAGSGELVALLRAKPGTLTEVALEDIAVAPGDRWIVGAGEDGMVKVWDANTCEPVTEFKTPEGDARTLQFETQPSNPAVLLTTGASGQTRRWEVGTWKPLGTAAPSNATLPSSSAPTASVAAAGDLVVTAVGNTAEVRYTRTPHADPVRLPGHLGPVLRVAFSPDGKTIATASGDKTVRLHRYAAFAPGDQLAKLADETFAIATTFWSAAPPSFHACPRPQSPR